MAELHRLKIGSLFYRTLILLTLYTVQSEDGLDTAETCSSVFSQIIKKILVALD
jgi:hypothetical protein